MVGEKSFGHRGASKMSSKAVLSKRYYTLYNCLLISLTVSSSLYLAMTIDPLALSIFPSQPALPPANSVASSRRRPLRGRVRTRDSIILKVSRRRDERALRVEAFGIFFSSLSFSPNTYLILFMGIFLALAHPLHSLDSCFRFPRLYGYVYVLIIGITIEEII